MNGRSIQVFCGLALVVACQGGGVANDFGPGLSDNAPTDPGAPADPNAPPPNPNDPPFADPTPVSDPCPDVCRELTALCPDEDPDEDDDYNECVQGCRGEIARCRDLAIAEARCRARNGCAFDEPGPQTDPNEPVVCEAERVRYITCVGPDQEPPDGEGGAGGI